VVLLEGRSLLRSRGACHGRAPVTGVHRDGLDLARKNWLHDSLRFSDRIVGIVFAVVLITVQAGCSCAS